MQRIRNGIAAGPDDVIVTNGGKFFMFGPAGAGNFSVGAGSAGAVEAVADGSGAGTVSSAWAKRVRPRRLVARKVRRLGMVRS